MSVPFRNTKITISDADFYFKEILIKSLIPPFDTVVKNCNNGYELIHQLHRKIEDVFFIDLFTPIMSGLEAIRYIRHTGNTTPIIAYSATYQEERYYQKYPLYSIAKRK
jgi:possible transcriptional regulator